MKPTRFVICLRNPGHEPSLKLRKLYEVVTDRVATRHGQVRIVDDSRGDRLYPASLFLDAALTTKARARVVQAA